MPTVASLIVRCSARFHDTANSIVSVSDWTGYLNDAYSWLHNNMGGAEWPHKQVTATITFGAGTGATALPTDAQRVLSAWNDTDDVLLIPIKGNVTPKARFGDATSGTPSFYRVFGNSVQVYPTPQASTSVVLDYLATPAILATGATGGVVTTPAIPAEYHQILVEYALFLAYVDDDNADVAGGHLQVAQGLLIQMQANLMSGQEDSYPQIVDAWWGP